MKGGDYLHLHWEFNNVSASVSEIVFVMNVSKTYFGCTIGFTGEILSTGGGSDIINL